MIGKFILGTKGSSTQMFDDNGVRMPVTTIQTSPCHLVGIKSMDVDGYWAVKLGFGKTKNIKKSQQGLVKKAGIKTPLRFLREVRLKNADYVSLNEKKNGIIIGGFEFKIGDELKPSTLFALGDSITLTGISKGKGFQGVIRRHSFAGGPKTHGQSDRERAPGSIGQGTTPGRVYKGKKMAGRMGCDTVTIKNLKVVEISDESLTIKGLLPGVEGGLIIIRSADPIPEKVEESATQPLSAKSSEGVNQISESDKPEKSEDRIQNSDSSEQKVEDKNEEPKIEEKTDEKPKEVKEKPESEANK